MFRKLPPQETQQQQMREVASPFWHTASSNSQRDARASTPERKVIGASYSHADILKFDDLSISSNSRPRTPPSLPRSKNTPPPKINSGAYTPPRRGYSNFLSSTDGAWEAEDGRDEEDALTYDEDEDEFGLPSITSMRRKSKRLQSKPGKDQGGIVSDHRKGTSSASASALWALDNGDVAEERALPTYPSAKKIEGKILRPQYKDILQDPANSLHLISHPPVLPGATAKERDAHASRITRINKFKKILQASSINLPELRNSAWSGLPSEVRAMSWQLLLGYLPTSSERRVATLDRKRREYLEGIRQAFERPASATRDRHSTGRGRGLDEAIWHQISIDVPRTNPHLELYSYEATQRSLERILYLWAIRHPASGYVQGINDLVTPFWQVFLGQYITDPNVETGMDPGQLPRPVLDAVEADSFWCLTKLLEGIQDNYIHMQPGITRQVSALRDLTARIDGALARHMEQEGVEFIQFSFRWMNCLLMREVSVRNTIRMWDTYLAEDQGFSAFHLYVCAAFLVKWSSQLLHMDFQEIMMFLQSLPTRDWTEKDVELLLSEAFIWKSLFAGSQAHVVKTRDALAEMLL
ncbi:GTPase-activating protein [Friedmanniomyces endolithicus]|nr:GTPase-activating protein [Friedmanniomyces endolithicus]KAK0274896.1 GTPase-activating protein [Friedmanniomyces endolithicus]